MSFPARERRIALGVYGMTIAVGLALVSLSALGSLALSRLLAPWGERGG